MTITLFEHNQKAYQAALSLMQQTGRAAVIHPTGSGKSFIGFQLAAEHENTVICWLAPSEYIFKTQIENLKSVTGGYCPDNIIFLTYARLMYMTEEEMAEINPAYIILDEFHRCGAEQWGKGVQNLLDFYSDIPVLGLSATNIRYLDNRRDMADELFDGNIASEMTLGEAIVRGILQPPTYVISIYSCQKELEKYQRRVTHQKNRGLRDTNQKYLEALRRALDKADGLDKIFQKHLPDKHGKYIVFCANVEHLNTMAAKVPQWFGGIDKAPHIYKAYADDPQTSEAFSQFKADKSEHLKLLFCIDMLNEGVHVEDIAGVILFRPTVSPIIYKQQIGRALAAGKNPQQAPLILDIVNNFDNLYSVGGLAEEMKTAAIYFRSIGEGEKVVNETFTIVDEVGDCRRIFEQLQTSLAASWDVMYAAAQSYYKKYGHLNIPARYKTAAGLTLGTWLVTQRRVKAGQIPGVLTDLQTAKLEAIGMIWDNRLELRWEQHFTYAEDYYKAMGHLNVPHNYLTSDGFPLGEWLSNMRQRKNSQSGGNVLTEERIKRLEAIGMVWSKLNYQWEKNYLAACSYYLEHGNLDVPVDYVDANGFRLGAWLRTLRASREVSDTGCSGSAAGRSLRTGNALTAEQIQRLDAIGMVWESRWDKQWNDKYEEAKAYYQEHGHLDVPFEYTTVLGTALGRWLFNMRKARTCPEKYNISVTAERIARLNAIGMIWDEGDPWNKRYELAKAYFEEHGDLNISSQYVTGEGIWLGKWLYEQRKFYNKGLKGKALTSEQICKLEAIGMNWLTPTEKAWEENFKLVQAYYEAHGHINIVFSYHTQDGKHIGRWLAGQRKRRAEGSYKVLTAERITRLDALGMDWQAAATKVDNSIAAANSSAAELPEERVAI